MRQCLNGDPRAQHVLYKRHVKALFHSVVRMVGISADAEDIVQEGFIKIFDHLETFRGESGLHAWMKRIMTNLAIDAVRKRKKINLLPIDEIELVVLPTAYEELATPDPKRIHTAIKNLPDGCRLVLTLYLFEGYKHREIADKLGISESTSKTQYRRAKLLLHDHLATTDNA